MNYSLGVQVREVIYATKRQINETSSFEKNLFTRCTLCISQIFKLKFLIIWYEFYFYISDNKQYCQTSYSLNFSPEGPQRKLIPNQKALYNVRYYSKAFQRSNFSRGLKKARKTFGREKVLLGKTSVATPKKWLLFPNFFPPIIGSHRTFMKMLIQFFFSASMFSHR